MVARIEARFHGTTEEVHVPDGLSSAGDLVRHLGLTTQECIVLVGGVPIPEDAPLPPEGPVMVIRVVSGG